jgi:hypothetical protein
LGPKRVNPALGVPPGLAVFVGSEDRGYVRHARAVARHRIRSFLWMQRASEFDLATAVPRQTASPGIFSMKKGRP